MTVINEVLDSFVQAIKAAPELASVRCVFADRNNGVQRPVTGYLMSAGIGRTEIGDRFMYGFAGENLFGREYRAELVFRLYSPKNAHGRELSEKIQGVAAELTAADAQGVIVSQSISEIRYDPEVCTLYCEVRASVLLFVCEEATDADHGFSKRQKHPCCNRWQYDRCGDKADC